jgi:Flp pilus assembly protein TadG
MLNCLQDRRGVSALMFTASAAGFLGMAGFGMEVSTWYLERRHGQNAADAAAIAGVLPLIQSQSDYTGAQTAGGNVARDNGYTTSTSTGTTVTIEPGTYGSGSFTAASGSCSSCNAVRATVVQAEPRAFTALILGSGSTNVGEVATAVLGVVGGSACSLALGGGLGFSGNASVTGTNCSLASNRPGSDSITFKGAGANKSQANALLIGAGGCTQSGTGSPCTQSGNLMYQTPTQDPYQSLQTDASAIPSTINASNCTQAATNTTLQSISPNVFCIGQNLKNFGTLNLGSGTYFFYNSSITTSSGDALTCTGCTIIFTGSNASHLGQLSINGGTVNMSAAKTNTYDTNYNGLLFYMDYRYAEEKSQSCGSVQVSIQGSSNITLNGGMYFPKASVCVTGNAFSASESCLSLVAWSIYYNGNATENLTGCSTTGTNTAKITAINLVQ